jgi:hypothetical protein
MNLCVRLEGSPRVNALPSSSSTWPEMSNKSNPVSLLPLLVCATIVLPSMNAITYLPPTHKEGLFWRTQETLSSVIIKKLREGWTEYMYSVGKSEIANDTVPRWTTNWTLQYAVHSFLVTYCLKHVRDSSGVCSMLSLFWKKAFSSLISQRIGSSAFSL